ncbi:hypothetical protein D3C72_373770 [compost metagenome]
MVLGHRQVVEIEADVGERKYQSACRGGTPQQTPGQRRLTKRQCPFAGRHLTHQIDRLGRVAQYAETQLRIVEIDLHLQGYRQNRRPLAISLIVTMAHFSDQRLDREGETQTTAAVGFDRGTRLARQCDNQTLKVFFKPVEPRIGGADCQ